MVSAHVCQYLIAVIVPDLLNGSRLEGSHAFDRLEHVRIKIRHVVVGEVFVVHQVPLAAGVFARPTVAFAREVNPFGMSEFVAHEVEVTAVDGGRCQHAYHLVEGDPRLTM